MARAGDPGARPAAHPAVRRRVPAMRGAVSDRRAPGDAPARHVHPGLHEPVQQRVPGADPAVHLRRLPAGVEQVTRAARPPGRRPAGLVAGRVGDRGRVHPGLLHGVHRRVGRHDHRARRFAVAAAPRTRLLRAVQPRRRDGLRQHRAAFLPEPPDLPLRRGQQHLGRPAGRARGALPGRVVTGPPDGRRAVRLQLPPRPCHEGPAPAVLVAGGLAGLPGCDLGGHSPDLAPRPARLRQDRARPDPLRHRPLHLRGRRCHQARHPLLQGRATHRRRLGRAGRRHRRRPRHGRRPQRLPVDREGRLQDGRVPPGQRRLAVHDVADAQRAAAGRRLHDGHLLGHGGGAAAADPARRGLRDQPAAPGHHLPGQPRGRVPDAAGRHEPLHLQPALQEAAAVGGSVDPPLDGDPTRDGHDHHVRPRSEHLAPRDLRLRDRRQGPGRAAAGAARRRKTRACSQAWKRRGRAGHG